MWDNTPNSPEEEPESLRKNNLETTEEKWLNPNPKHSKYFCLYIVIDE